MIAADVYEAIQLKKAMEIIAKQTKVMEGETTKKRLVSPLRALLLLIISLIMIWIWLVLAGKPVFRPIRLSFGMDWINFVGGADWAQQWLPSNRLQRNVQC